MRTSVLDTLLPTLRLNVSRGMRDVAVYELGLVTHASSGRSSAPIPPVDRRPDDATVAEIEAAVPDQPRHVAFAATGEIERGGPWGPARAVDVTDAVAWARTLGRVVGLDLDVAAADIAPFHPGRCAVVRTAEGEVVGHVGELHPKVCSVLEVPARTVAGELDVDVLVAATGAPLTAEPLSTYPVARTDIALVVEDSVPAGSVETALRGGAGDLLEEVTLFDVYHGDQVGPGRKSLAYRLTFRPVDRTLTTEEVSALRDAAVAAAGESTGAVQRT